MVKLFDWLFGIKRKSYIERFDEGASLETKLSVAEIFNCEKAFSKVCPVIWQELAGDGNIRHCESCNKDVHLCKTADDYIEKGKKGFCVAIPQDARVENFSICFLGEPSQENIKEAEELKKKCSSFWSKVVSNSNFLSSDITNSIKQKL